MIKKMLLVAASAIAGIYLTSDEGGNARKAIQKKRFIVEPIIKDLLNQANDVLEGTKELNSDEIRANIEMIVNEAKDSLIKLDLDKASETIKDAIRVASKQIRDASNEVEKDKRIKHKSTISKKATIKTQTVKKTQIKSPSSKKAGNK